MRKLDTLLVLLFVWNLPLLAQNIHLTFPEEEKQEDPKRIVDSLEQLLPDLADTNRWENLHRLSQSYRRFPRKDSTALQKGIRYSREAEQLAISMNDTSKWYQSLRLLIAFYERVDSLEALANEKKTSAIPTTSNPRLFDPQRLS